MLNTRASDNFNANEIVNPNDLRKHILSVDSRFRTNWGDLSTNFSYELAHAYKNVIRMRIASVEIPNTFYTFTTLNNSFSIKAKDITNVTREVTITIAPGNYTSTELLTQLQDLLTAGLRDPYGIFMTIALDPNTAKVTITHEGVSAYPVTSPTPAPTASAKPFTVLFASLDTFMKRYSCFGLGYNLGFRMPTYSVTNAVPVTGPPALTTYTVTGEAILDVRGDRYALLSVNDMHTVEHKTQDGSYLQALAKVVIRGEKYSVIYDDGASLISNEIIFPSPMDLKYLQVKLIDAYGNVIDLNGADLSFTVEITEVLNPKLYDFYRNYIWTGTVPTVKRPQGSSMPLLGGMGGVVRM